MGEKKKPCHYQRLLRASVGERREESQGEKRVAWSLLPAGKIFMRKVKDRKREENGRGGIGLKPLVSYQCSNKNGRSQGEDHTFLYDL